MSGQRTKDSPNQSGKSGPFEVRFETTRERSLRSFGSTAVSRRPTQGEAIEGEDLHVPAAEPPLRRYECTFYDTCLDLAAALNWSSFTCKGCNGVVNQSLYWRAHHNQRKDALARAICELPPITSIEGQKEESVDGVDRQVKS